MRIVAGKYKGRKLPFMKEGTLRPTTDYAREALMNILNNALDLEECRVLDLFAGTGAMSFELLSRGVKSSTCVESNKIHYNYIRSAATFLNEKNITILMTDVFLFIKKNETPYSIVFADPPYDLKNLSELPQLILDSNSMNGDSTLIVEHPESIDFSKVAGFYNHKNYGKVNFSFFRKEENNPSTTLSNE
jgi:16S rRNA (guanine966-N2)-methyltransferase